MHPAGGYYFVQDPSHMELVFGSHLREPSFVVARPPTVWVYQDIVLQHAPTRAALIMPVRAGKKWDTYRPIRFEAELTPAEAPLLQALKYVSW